MSRSYKKTPSCTAGRDKLGKKLANSKVRSTLKDDLDNTSASSYYKKLYNSYNIVDFYNSCSWVKYYKAKLAQLKLDGEYVDKKRIYQQWKKMFLRK